ncbi:MAG: DciA family protein [Leptospirillum sp.]
MGFTKLGPLTRALALQWASKEDFLLATMRKEWARWFPGPVSTHSRPWSYAQNILVIAVDTPLHRKEFSFLEPQFRQAIKQIFQEIPDFAIRFRVQPRTFQENAVPPKTGPLPESKMAIIEQQAREIANGISDSARREAAFRFVLVCMIRGEALGLGLQVPAIDKTPSTKLLQP